LDELIRAVQPARTALMQREDLSDAELDNLHGEFQKLRDDAASRLGEIEASRKRRQSG
jgi:hypothetical protein